MKGVISMDMDMASALVDERRPTGISHTVVTEFWVTIIVYFNRPLPQGGLL